MIEKANDRLAAVAGRLESLSPLAVLTRGYSLTFCDGQIVLDTSTVNVGDSITSRLAHGQVVSTITATDVS
jgi:exodeoxyribonuclease VII large subunit